MANYVSTGITFYNQNDQDGLDKYMDEVLASVEQDDQTPIHKVLEAFGYPTPDEDEIKIGWYHEHVGPKWCFLEDFGGGEFRTNSAWATPTTMVENIVALVNEKFPQTFAVTTYEDESYNFVGSALITDEGLDDTDEYEYDDLMQMFVEQKNLDIEPDEVFEDDDATDQFYEWVSDLTFDDSTNTHKRHVEYLNEINEE